MKLDGFELRRIALPLVRPFQTSFGTQTSRDVLLVKAVSPDGEGWGECVALSEPVYSNEYVESAAHVIEHHLIPRLGGDVDASAAEQRLSRVRGHLMAKAALGMAVLDAELRAKSESLSAFLGAVRREVDCGVSVGIADSVDALLDEVGAYVDQGYRRIKLKIKPGWDIAAVAAVREQFPSIPLQADANAAYSLADARHLAKLDAFELLLIEQPLPEDDILGHADLAKAIRTPICLDESITNARTAAAAIRLGACSVVNIKPGRVGGYLEARRVHDVCVASGVPVWCGGMLETGIGRAANVALAALPGFTLPGDTSASDRYFRRDIAGPFVLHNGRLRVPDGPGIGVHVDIAALDEVTTTVRFVHVA